ncbi:nucleoporin AMO1, partial [Teratosphaeria destructans]
NTSSDNCKNEHPGSNQQPANRFSALSNAPQSFGNRNRSGGFGGDRPGNNDKLPYHLARDSIRIDLSDGKDGERPHWRLSAYGPGKDAPRQLLEGEIEQSPEELRVQAYLAQQAGRFNDYVQLEANAFRQADQQVNTALNDLDGAIKYVLDGENIHPNRLDQANRANNSLSTSSQPASGFGQPASSGFGQPSQPAFGAPSQPGNPASGAPSAFAAAKPAFGAPTQPSAFGTPSAFGAAAKPAFGAPSQPGAGSAFGAPSALGGGSAFGAPSALGGQKSAFGAPSHSGTGAFGAPSTLGQQKPAFGAASQPGASAFGAPSQPGAVAFGAPSQSGAGAFGAPSTLGQQKPAFGAPTQPSTGAFGAPSALGQQKSAFGAPSQPAFGTPSQPTSGFGQPSVFGGGQQTSSSGCNTPTPSGFGQVGQSQPSQPSAFGGGAIAKPNPFASTEQANGNAFKPSPFGAPAQQTNGITQSTTPFDSTSQPVNGTQPISERPPTGTFVGGRQYTSSYTNRTPQGTLQTWKGKPVSWERIADGPPCPFISYATVVGGQQKETSERIWHPDGPPERESEDALDKAELYTGDLGAVLKELYEYVRETGEFKDGIVPEIPPKREWVRWDL